MQTPSRIPDVPPPRWRVLAAALGPPAGLLIAAVLVYLPCLRAGFIMDDNAMLTENPLIAAADGIRRFWYTAQPVNFYGPVTASSLWLEWRLWGLDPRGYHATNLALHAAEVLLLWGVLRRLRLPGAWLAALLFAVHPLNVETVAWIAQRKNLVAMLFVLLSVRFFLNTGLADPPEAGGPARPGGRRWYGLSWLAFVLALLSKGSAAPLPLVLLGLIAWRRRPAGRDLARLAPFFAAAAGVAAIDVWTQRLGDYDVIRSAGFAERLLGAAAAGWFYLGKALWPARLIFVYPQWRIAPGNHAWWLPLAAAAGCTWLLWHGRRRWSRAALFAWGYFWVMLAPVLGFTDVYFMKYALVADHYAHLALIGVVAWAAALVTLAWRRLSPAAKARWRLPAAAGAVAAIGALGTATWRQNETYRDARTLYQATVDANPASWLAHNNLAVQLALMPGGRPAAIAHYREALRLNPDYAEAHNNLGIELEAEDRPLEAIPQLEAALRLHLDLPEVHARLGALYAKVGRSPEAIAEDEAAVRLQPDRAKGHLDLGLALAAAGQGSRAIAEEEEALRLDPSFADAAYFLGISLAQAGRNADAIAAYERALALRPDYAVAHNNLGVALCNSGQVAAAVPHYREAIRLNPADPQAQSNLGFALASLGQAAEAIRAFQRAAELAPASPAARVALGNALYVAGQVDPAALQFAAAIRLDPQDADAHNDLGICWAARRQFDRAAAEFETAAELRPGFAAAELNWSRSLQELGQPEAAALHRRRAAQLQAAGGR